MMKVVFFCIFVGMATALGVGTGGVSLIRQSGISYYISSEAATFPQAWAFCENYGMKFISFNQATDTKKLVQYLDNMGISPNKFWIGGIYLQSGLMNKWYWVNGDSFIYTNFVDESRIMYGDKCLRLVYNANDDYNKTTISGQWESICCSYKYNFICRN